jgi:myo-inositol-1(or 4)-monophosphatase
MTDQRRTDHEVGVLSRIREALAVADSILKGFTPGAVEARLKAGDDPVTEADIAVDRALRSLLVDDGEGWLSEETADRPDRIAKSRLWIVDPIDGTREFVSGIPEWCVSIGYVVDGEAVAGGILNRAAGQTITGSISTGVRLNGSEVRVRGATRLTDALVLASRSEVNRGEWKRFDGAPFSVRPLGSIAYKLALVASGLADATWTLVPKNEWDIAAGVALVRSAGGIACTLDWTPPRFNGSLDTLVNGLVAGGERLVPAIREFLAREDGSRF